MRKAAVALAAALTLAAVSAAGPAFADQPGPGDTLCVPGQNGNPTRDSRQGCATTSRTPCEGPDRGSFLMGSFREPPP